MCIKSEYFGILILILKLITAIIDGYSLKSHYRHRIIEGTPADIKKFKFMVCLVVPKWYTKQKKSDEPFCGGSIITSSWVLTAAHCLKSYDPMLQRTVTVEKSKVIVRGNTSWCRNGKTKVDHTIIAFYTHFLYDPVFKTNDVGVIKIKGYFKGKFEENIRMIPPRYPPQYQGTLTGYVLGWGILKEGDQQGSSQLHFADVEVITLETCKSIYHANNYSPPPGSFCAGGCKNVCLGDDGGPLIVEEKKPNKKPYFVQLGITSLQILECTYPAIYVNVSMAANWIKTTIKRNPKEIH